MSKKELQDKIDRLEADAAQMRAVCRSLKDTIGVLKRLCNLSNACHRVKNERAPNKAAHKSPWGSGNIFTDGRGVPIDRPEPDEYDDTVSFIRAVAEYNKVHSK